MATDSQPTDPLRGTIIVADEVYLTQQSKWIIAGTYSNWNTNDPVLHLPKGIAMYARIQTERKGKHNVEILLFDRARQPNIQPLWRLQADVDVGDPLTPIEIGLNTNPMQFARPPEPGSDGFHRIRLSIWLEVDGKSVASAPLLIHFSIPNEK